MLKREWKCLSASALYPRFTGRKRRSASSNAEASALPQENREEMIVAIFS
jgi:hypothetical protein